MYHVTASSLPGFFFREPSRIFDPRKQDNAIARDKNKEAPSVDRGFLLCVQCRQIITAWVDRMEVGGSHRHTFANPHGIVFEIGCFSAAKGCGIAGPATDDFSWFTGYCWEIAYCRSCLTHLGWRFASGNTNGFYALILDRLVESGG
jgi:hypothetical protein